MELVFEEFVRKPFKIEAVQVTVENIAELAPLIGTLRAKPDDTPYIQVKPRLVPNVFRVYPGYWVTRMGENIRCYNNTIFNDQFVVKTPGMDAMFEWVDAGASVD